MNYFGVLRLDHFTYGGIGIVQKQHSSAFITGSSPFPHLRESIAL